MLTVLFLAALETEAYQVVTKDGKTVKGRLVRETDDLFILIAEKGTAINIKKADVDLEKTAEANKNDKSEEKGATTQNSGIEYWQKKGAARKVTKEDLEKIREKHDLGSGTFKPQEKETEEDDSTAGSQSSKSGKQSKEKKDWVETTAETAKPFLEEVLVQRRRQASLWERCSSELLASGVVVLDSQGAVMDFLVSPQTESLRPACTGILEAQQEIEEIKERARRAEVPMQWMDEW